jgi:plastocyanin
MAIIVITSCTQYKIGGPENTTDSISIVMVQFSPVSTTVEAGTTVTWTNNDAMAHTVTSTTGLFNSDTLLPTKKFSYKFTTPGSFSYKCLIHSNMSGTIKVE